VSIGNTDPERPVAIQSSGYQRYLESWGPFQPSPAIDYRSRVTSTSPMSFEKDLFVISSVSKGTREVVYKYKPPASSGLYSGHPPDRRPTRADFTVLVPGKPFVRTCDLDDILVGSLGLLDGAYLIGLDTVGAWWCWGSLDEMFDGNAEESVGMEAAKIPSESYQKNQPPIWLISEDEVAVRIRDAKVI
jgi:hypothetical protein